MRSPPAISRRLPACVSALTMLFVTCMPTYHSSWKHPASRFVAQSLPEPKKSISPASLSSSKALLELMQLRGGAKDSEDSPNPKKRFGIRALGRGVRHIVGSTAGATKRITRGVRSGISRFIARRRQRRLSREEAMWESGVIEIDGENVPISSSGSFLCCCCQAVRNTIWGSRGVRRAFDCILPQSLWFPNVLPNLAVKDWTNYTKTSSTGGFSGRWVKIASLNQNWALALLGYTRVQRAIIERVSIPLDIQMTNNSFVVRTQGFRSFHTEYPLNGQEITYSRRDGRPGNCRARVVSKTNNTVTLHLDWDNPFGGENIQTYRLKATKEDHAKSIGNNDKKDYEDLNDEKNPLICSRLLIENKIRLILKKCNGTNLRTGDSNSQEVTSYVEFRRVSSSSTSSLAPVHSSSSTSLSSQPTQQQNVTS
mmetsp:Transcript_34471/g.83376  ORF Transcript_34471/g.83376 Transcript_34471/m.83376 type:complete len:425 (+) Transcript_34471:116-1390(+)